MPLAAVCEQSGKTCYGYAEARSRAKTARRKHDERDIHEYHCKSCGCWHYGHSVSRITQRLGRRPRRY